jgi:hypothetical protein
MVAAFRPRFRGGVTIRAAEGSSCFRSGVQSAPSVMPGSHMKALPLLPTTLLLFGTFCLAPLSALSQDLLDPSGLKLQVTRAERTPDTVICSSATGEPGLAATEPGGQFVRVVLQGKTTRSGPLILPDSAFFAVFDKEKPGSPGNVQKGVANAAALCLEEGLLMLTTPTQFREYSVSPGPISVTLLFAIPQNVDHFQIIYPALAGGTATLGTKMAVRQQR